MRKAKKNFHVVMKTFIQKNLLKTYIQPKKMDFLLVLQVTQEIWNFVLRLARHRKWKKSPTILTLHALLKDVCQLT